MNKNIFYAIALICAIAFTGCKDKNTAEEPSQPAENTQAMTADQQKDYLERSGKQILATFNAVDQKEAADLAEGLYRKYENYDWDAIADKLADIDDGRYENLFSAPKRLVALTQGLSVPAANDVIVFSFAGNAYNFEIDEQKQTINYVRSTDGTCTVKFRDEKGKSCVLKAWGEGKTSSYQYTYETDRGKKTIQADVPAAIHVTLKQGDTEVINAVIEIEAVKNNHFYSKLNLKVTNVTVKYDLRVNSTNGTAIVEVLYGNKNLVTASIDLPKYKLIDKADNQDWEAWIEQYEERYEELLMAIGSGAGQIKLMDLVTIKANVKSGKDLYTTINNWDGEDTKASCQAFCEGLNKAFSAGLYFPSDPNTLQVEVRMQPRAYEGEKYDPISETYIPYTSYDPEPVLYFPKDRTSYAFEEYFTMNRFNTIIDMAENVVNSYIDLDSEFELEHVHF